MFTPDNQVLLLAIHNKVITNKDKYILYRLYTPDDCGLGDAKHIKVQSG